ncbi:MAG: HAD family phosphatase [Planctomycetota bacterium]|nr:HAD family phosphatase [Planctomycetota bacterium]
MPAPEALIFDMDQTLVDSAPIWRGGVLALFRFLEKTCTPEIAAHFAGLNIYDIASKAVELTGAPVDIKEAQRIAHDALVERYRQGQVTEMPGAAALVERLHGLAPLIVASGSPLEGIARATEQLQIRSKFTELLSSESVPRGKPHPDVFLKAAALVGANPQRCLVFEDSVVGAQAARAAGMACFVVPSCAPALLEPLATRIFGHWDEVSWELASKAEPKTWD